MKRTLRYNVICALCAGLTAVLFQVLFAFSETMTAQMILLIISALIYLVPFILNLRLIRGYCIDRVSRFVFSDIIFIIAPAIVFSALAEALVLPFTEIRLIDGIGSLLLAAVVVFEALIMWIAYYIANKVS